jgi:hypothetical protein
MNRLRILAIGAVLIAGSSALAVAQPNDHRDGRQEDRGRNNDGRGKNFNNGGRNFDNDRGRGFDKDRGFRDNKPNAIYWRDRDADRHFDRDRVVVVNRPYFVGERRFFNGFYWTWDGDRWCRRDHGIQIFFSF